MNLKTFDFRNSLSFLCLFCAIKYIKKGKKFLLEVVINDTESFDFKIA